MPHLAQRLPAAVNMRHDAAELVALLKLARAGRRVAKARVHQLDEAQRLLVLGISNASRLLCGGQVAGGRRAGGRGHAASLL